MINIQHKMKFLDAGQLKIIAYISMMLDHLNKSTLLPYLYYNDTYTPTLSMITTIFSVIGTFAFPIFCYLIVESFHKTRNFNKMLVLLLMIALVSEIPFDLAFYEKPFEWGHQNIFFSMINIMLFMKLNNWYTTRNKNIRKIEKVLFFIVTLLPFVWVAELLAFDFGVYGITLGAIFYLGYKAYDNKQSLKRWILPKVFGYILFLKELLSFPVFILLCFYNGERGKQSKWLNYLFYPVHLTILTIVSIVLIQQ